MHAESDEKIGFDSTTTNRMLFIWFSSRLIGCSTVVQIQQYSRKNKSDESLDFI
jgi:hypothetical protein